MANKMADQLFGQFQQTANMMRRYLHQAGREADGGAMLQGQGRLLRILSEKQGISQKELAEKMHIRPASLSELITKLETKGYVVRVQNQDDKRVYNIRLTPVGSELARQLAQAKTGYGRDIFSVLNETEAKQLTAILDKLAHAIELKSDDVR